MDLDNSAFYQRAKSQLKIIHILVYIKITKSDRIWRVQIWRYSQLLDSDFVIFIQTKIQHYFYLRFYTLIEDNIIYIQNCFQIFSELQNMNFIFFLQNKGFHLSTLIGIGHPNAKRIAEAK